MRTTELLEIINQCAAEAKKGTHLTVGLVMDRFAEAGYSFICIILCLPFLQPISLGPISTLNGLALAALGWQLAMRRSVPWLPRRMRDAALSPRFWSLLLGLCSRVFRICRTFSRPRWRPLIESRYAHLLNGGMIVASGLLLSIPLPGIPFNNTMPAIVMILVSIAELERDGLFVVLAMLWFILTLSYFGFLVYGFFFVGRHVLGWI